MMYNQKRKEKRENRIFIVAGVFATALTVIPVLIVMFL